MNFQTRVKHINKSLTKYSRLLFVLLSITGVLLSFFISNVSQFKVNKADTLVGTGVAGLYTNGVLKLATLKDNSEQMLTYTMQWGSPYFQINSHYNASDYNQFSVCDTGVSPSVLNGGRNAIATSDDGTTYFVDTDNNELDIYSFNSCVQTAYSIDNFDTADEPVNAVILDPNTDDVYVIQNTRIILLPSVDYSAAESYNYINGRTNGKFAAVNTDDNKLYVVFDNSYVQTFDIDNSYSVTENNLSTTLTCGEKIIYNNSKIYIGDDCSTRVVEYNTNFFNTNTYFWAAILRDFAVNDDFIYFSTNDRVVKFDKGNPASPTVADQLSGVDFYSIDYIGNDIMDLSGYFREVYKFTLTIDNGGGGGGYTCPVVSPEYNLNVDRCERWLYSFTETNFTGVGANQSLITNAGEIGVLHGLGGYTGGGIWLSNNGFTPFPAEFHYPVRMRASTDNKLYILFQSDDNFSGDPAIVSFDLNTFTYDNEYPFTGFQVGNPRDFIINSVGDLVTFNHVDPAGTSYTVFPAGDYSNPFDQAADFDFSSFSSITMEADQNDNLYMVSGQNFRIINYNGGAYDSSSIIDLGLHNVSGPKDIQVRHNPLGGEDVYISGQGAGTVPTVHKFTNLDLGGGFDSEQSYNSTYGRYSSYQFLSITVDPYGNIFAVPENSATQIAWFTPEGTLHDFAMNDSNGLIRDVMLSSQNDLYVTSLNIEYQEFDYDYLAATGGGGGGGGDPCPVVSPLYIQNTTRCERYLPNAGRDDDTSVDVGENFVDSVRDNGHFFASTNNNRIYAVDNYYSLPAGFHGIYNLKADKSIRNGVFFITYEDGTDYAQIMHYYLDNHTFDFYYDTASTLTNIDFDVNSLGSVFVLGLHIDGTFQFQTFAEGDYTNPQIVNPSYSYPDGGLCKFFMQFTATSDIITACGSDMLGIDHTNGYVDGLFFTTTNAPWGFGGGPITDLIVKERMDSKIDIYVAGRTDAGIGSVIRFTGMDLVANNWDSRDVFTDNTFNGMSVNDIFVANNGSIFASSENLNDKMVRFLADGTPEVIDTIVDHGPIEDILVSPQYELYVTSSAYAYQLFEFDFRPIYVSGTNNCVIGGSVNPLTFFAFDPTTATIFVDGNPDPFPMVYPTGFIEIRANGLPVGTATLDGVAEAVQDFTIEYPGIYTISFFYTGDSNYSSCSLNITSVTVNSTNGGSVASQVDFVSINPTNYRQYTGEDMFIRFHVNDTSNPSNVPTGDVELRQDICCSGGYNLLDTQPIDVNGDVVFNTKDLRPGIYGVYATYLGDSTYTTSNSIFFVFSISSFGTRVTLDTTQNPVVKGNSITLHAHVDYQNIIPSGGSQVEKRGWVRFRTADNTYIGEGLIDLNGDVSIVVNTSDGPIGPENLNAGVHHIRAYYTPDHESRDVWLRSSNSNTLFQVVEESGSGGGSNTGSDIPPSGGEGGNSDFSATITGKDKTTGSTSQTKIGSLLSWVMSYNNLGPNSNQAITYFPIRENQDFVIGSVNAPVSWTITYSQDQSCDDSTFTYTPVGANGATDPLVRCVRFANNRINVPPTRSDVRYITTSSNFTELNVSALGGTDVYKVVPDTNSNRLFYFNHHYGANMSDWPGGRSMFCFDLEINDTCVSKNPDTVYPVNLGLDGWNDSDDMIMVSETSFSVNAQIVDNKIYVPMTNVNFQDGINNGNGFLCWDLDTDFYCNGPSFKSGIVILNTTAVNSWGWGNIGDIEFNPDMQEVYSMAVGPTNGYMELLCYSTALNTPCPGQPYVLGTNGGYDPGWGLVEYQHSTGRIYTSGGGNNGTLVRPIQCLIAATKTICPDFPAGGIQILPNQPDQSVFINPENDQMCALIYSDGYNSDGSHPKVYCYDLNTQTFYDYLPSMSAVPYMEWQSVDHSGPYTQGKFYFKVRHEAVWGIFCFDLSTKEQCAGWEGGRTTAPMDIAVYTMREAFGCMWAASDSGRVFTFDPDTGESCNPLITLSQGNVAVKLDANNMFCATDPDDITWNKVKVLDSGTSPSPALLNASVYDSAQCTTDNDNVVSCTGSPLKSGNLLLNSGHEMDISDINYNAHKSLVAILEFQYPTVPSPAPGFYIELNPTNKAQMCADTKLLFSGALCANPITTVCENTNISYINDPVSNNNGGQYCLNVETYFGKDPNSALCFVAATPEQRIFTVFNPNATVGDIGSVPVFNPEQTYNRGPGNYSFGNGFFGFFQNIIENTIPQVVNQETVRQIVESVNTQTPLAVTAVTAITTATVVVTSVFAAGSGIGQIFGVLLGFLAPRKKKYWGIIFDDFTNKPVAFASITLSIKEIGKDNQMKSTVITQAVSDLDGRYRLNTDKRDKFYLEVKASGYQPFTKFISMTNPLNSAEDIVYDIPLRRLDAKSNFIKSILSYRKKGFINVARFILLISSLFGFMFTIYSQINFPNNLNLILLAIYIVIFIITFYPSIYNRIQKRGKVIDVDFNSPIPGAVVRIYDTKQQIALSLTNLNGEARFDVPAGEYSILASKRGYRLVAEEGKQLVKATLKTEGYLDRNLLMKRIEEAPLQSNTGLDNPFA